MKFLVMLIAFIVTGITLVDSSSQFKTTTTQYVNVSRAKRAILRFGSCKSVLSGDCLSSNITFMLFTNPYSTIGTKIIFKRNLKNFNLLLSNFDPKLPTKIIIHGYNSNMFLSDLVKIKDEYLNRTNLNVIFVDWSDLGEGPCYPAAVWNSNFVGKCTAQLIDKISEAGGRDIHLIGFSVGAHVAGFAANNIKSLRISRITGLDPAMPGFIFVGNNKLDPTDAIFVDVIHTNALMQGVVEPTGHADFYLNGGSLQPGCGTDIFDCNHHRALKYFAESINSDIGFWAWPCTSYFYYVIGLCSSDKAKTLMGEHMDKSTRGVYFLTTNNKRPFALGFY